MNKIREIIRFIGANLADVLCIAGLFLFVLTMFIFVGAFEGMIAISTILFLSGVVLSYIKAKQRK